MVLHIPGRRLRIGIIPGRVRVLLPVDNNRVIPSLPLPWAARSRRTGLQKFSLYRLVGKINVAFNRLKLLALGQGLAVPNCLRHRIRFSFFSISCGGLSEPDTPSPEAVGAQSLHAFVTETTQ